MFRILRLVLASILVAGFVGTTAADDRDAWSIVQTSGTIWVQPDGAQRVSLGDTKVLEPGTTLATSKGGRVLLQRGRETMVVGPGTIMKVPRGSSRLFTTVIQWIGEIEFDVDKRNVQHFGVRTPYLAALVKGTHFAVRAGEQSGSVAVERGIVEVRSLRTGEKRDLRPGQSAEVLSDGRIVFAGDDHADAGSGAFDAASNSSQAPGVGGPGGSGGVSAGVGDLASVGVGGGEGVNVNVGGENGVSASVGGGNGVSASVGGSGGVSVNAGGGGGVNVNVGGVGIGLGGH